MARPALLAAGALALLAMAMVPAAAQDCPEFRCTPPPSIAGKAGMYINCASSATYPPLSYVSDSIIGEQPPFIYVFDKPQIQCAWLNGTAIPLETIRVEIGFTCPAPAPADGTPIHSFVVSPCGSKFGPVPIIRQPGFTLAPSPSPKIPSPSPEIPSPSPQIPSPSPQIPSPSPEIPSPSPEIPSPSPEIPSPSPEVPSPSPEVPSPSPVSCPGPDSPSVLASCNSVSNPNPLRTGGYLACQPGVLYPAGTTAAAFPLPPLSPTKTPLDCAPYPLHTLRTAADFTCSTTGGGTPADIVLLCSGCAPATCARVFINPINPARAGSG